jgi:hypothetical protein
VHEWYLHYLKSKMVNSKWSQILFKDIITLAALFLCNIILAFATDPSIQQEQDRIVTALPAQVKTSTSTLNTILVILQLTRMLVGHYFTGSLKQII